MLELLEDGDLANRRARYSFVLVLQSNLLQGHDLVGLLLATLVHLAVGALADLLGALVVGQHAELANGITGESLEVVHWKSFAHNQLVVQCGT